jgi:hypothetical protein
MPKENLPVQSSNWQVVFRYPRGDSNALGRVPQTAALIALPCKAQAPRSRARPISARPGVAGQVLPEGEILWFGRTGAQEGHIGQGQDLSARLTNLHQG